jgi:two-component system phosphate regulon sensor histidine kinase PhoR
MTQTILYEDQVEELQRRLEEAEDALRAIRSGQVDASVVSGAGGREQLFVLTGAEQPYRVFLETMNEGAVTLLPAGAIAYSNSRFAEIVQTPLEQVIGARFA